MGKKWDEMKEGGELSEGIKETIIDKRRYYKGNKSEEFCIEVIHEGRETERERMECSSNNIKESSYLVY